MQNADTVTITPSKWAILIGLDFYVDPKQRLRGAVNDVDDVQLFLSRNHAIKRLTKLVAISTEDESQSEPAGSESSWPTHENVTGELKRVTESAAKGDFVYIHYSGHGTLSPTTAKEYVEDPGSDTALVLYDRVTGVRYLRGIELASLLNQMVHKGLQLTVVLDCCHAGAVSRSKRHLVRGVSWDTGVACAHPVFLQAPPSGLVPSNARDRDASTNQHWLLHPQGYTLLAACGPTELASECSGPDGRLHGALTFFLFKALSTLSRVDLVMNLGPIHRRLCAELRIVLPLPHPVLLGNETSMLLSRDHMERPSRGGCNVSEILKDGRIVLDAGRAHMVSVGDDYILKPFPSNNNQIIERSAVFRIVAVHDLDSEAELIQPQRDALTIAKGWHAVLSKPCRARAKVASLGHHDQAFDELIANSPWLDQVESITELSSTLSFSVTFKNSSTVVVHQGVDVEMKYLPQDINSEKDGCKRLVNVLEHLAKFAVIEGLGSDLLGSLTSPEPGIDSGTRIMPSKSGFDFSINIGHYPHDRKDMPSNIISVHDGEMISITFENHTRQSLFLTVFNLTPMRKVTKIYPSSDRGQYKEIPPWSVNFTGRAAFKMRMTFPDVLQSEDLEEVEDILKFFISTRPVLTLVDALELPELSQQGLDKSRSHSSGQMLLELCDNLNALCSSGGTSRTERGRWTCANYLVRTLRKISPTTGGCLES